jgi:hypothetical protein
MDANAQLLQAILRRESRSLLQYAGEAFPWTTSRQKETLAGLTKIIEEERTVAAEFAGWLAKKRLSPTYLGPYPSNFTNMNFVTLDFFLRLLVDYQKQAIADLERDLPRITDPEALGIVQKILITKRRHLEVLLDLSGGKPQAA